MSETLHTQASGFIEQRDFGNWSDEDQARLDAWIDRSPAHRIAFLRADASWKRTEMLTALRPFRAERVTPDKPARKGSWKIAAALIVCGALGAGAAFYFQAPQPHYTTYTTAIGGHKTLALADGTEIELNTDTVVRLLNGDNRKVWLDRGEAFFAVHHDAMRPFEVTVGDHKITDLGTKFLVKHHSDDTEVALIEGSARFDGESRSLTLTPGDVVVANAQAISVSRKKPAVLSTELGWRHGVLIFEQMSLYAVASELNRYNQKKLVVADAAAGGVKIGGTFRTDDVQAIANAAREVFGLHVEDRGSEIVISR